LGALNDERKWKEIKARRRYKRKIEEKENEVETRVYELYRK
jgi:hypothetical protein